MNPVLMRLTGRYVSRRFFQSVLFVLGIALGVAVGVAIDLANASASRAFNLSTESIAGRTTHQITTGPGGLPTDLYRQVRADLGLRLSAPVVDQTVIAVTLGEQPIRMLGVDVFAEAPFRDYFTTANAEAENREAFDALNTFITQPGSVLISDVLAGQFGLEVGDSITLQLNDRQAEVTIVGLLEPGDEVSAQAVQNLMLADIATAQELVGQPDRITRIDLILPPDYDLSQLESILPQGARLVRPQDTNSALSQITAAFELNLQALSLLALIVGIFLIYNTVTFSVVQRRPVIGVMRSLGATRQQIFALILGEALLLGAVGTLLGLGLGILFGRGAVRLVAQTISDLYFRVNVEGVTVQPITLAKGAIIGMAASLLAALVPSYSATHTPPAGVMRRSDFEEQSRKLAPLSSGAGLAGIVLGVLVLQLRTQSIPLSFTGLFLVLIGCALFTPPLMVGLLRLLTPLTGALFGVVGRMAPRAVLRSLSRTSIATAALMLSVSVIVGLGVMVSSFRNTVSDWLDTTLSADVFISPPATNATGAGGNVDPALLDRLSALDGVQNVAWVRTTTVLAPDYPDLPPVNLAVVDRDIASDRRFAWLDWPTDNYREALAAGHIIVSEAFAFRRGLSPDNNQLTLLTDRGLHTFEVVGIYYDYTTDQGRVIMYDSVYRNLYDDPYISSIGLTLSANADEAALINQLRTETLVGKNLQVQSNRELRQSVFEVFDRAFEITVALRGLATLVAFIGILSTLLALQLEHTRQYGVMRANGMTPRQMWGFTLIQTGLMGTVAGVVALPVGLVLALVLIFVINVRSFGWTMQLTLASGEFTQAFLVAFVAALLAGLYPAWRLARLALTEALRSE